LKNIHSNNEYYSTPTSTTEEPIINMEKQLNKQIEQYLAAFKDSIRNKMLELEFAQNPQTNSLLEFIYEYDRLIINKDELSKKKRVKQDIETEKRCSAYRADTKQCTRRKKQGSEYCGTHVKGIPNGIVSPEEECENHKHSSQKVEVVAREIDGIVYYIDDSQNVYKTEDVMNNIENPRQIGTCRKINETEFVEYKNA
jgi:hypothetical protein